MQTIPLMQQSSSAFLLHEDQVLTPPMPTWKKYARIILPHVGLILLSLFYIVGGAFVFYQVEGPNEIAVRRENELWLIINDNATTQEEAEILALEHVTLCPAFCLKPLTLTNQHFPSS
uniref:Uncharacterized protein n=1 Tax=Ditylenchus dipsaci TaxID=166011 RepID=A0A915CV03_9BILA